MKTRTYITILMLVMSLVLSNVLSAQDVLNQYLEMAAQNNPELKAKFNAYNAALEKVPQVGALPDPQLMFGYFIMPVETKNGPQQAKLSITQMLPWFGTLSSKEDVVLNAAKSKYEVFEEAKSNLFFDVKSSFYDLYFIDRGLDITLKNIQILERFKQLALIKIETGKATGVDALRVDMEIADLENNLALLRDQKHVTRVKFNKLLNTDQNSPVDVPEALWVNDLTYSLQAIIDRVNLNNHQLKRLDFIHQSFVSQQQLAKKQGTPNLILGVDYTSIGSAGSSTDAGKDALMFKVGLTMPLYRKKYSAMVRESILQQKVIEDKKVQKKNVLELLIEKTYSEYSDADRRISLFEKQSDLADRAIKLLESEYANNGKNFEDILKMEKRLLKYSLQLEKAKADKQAAIAFINYLIGS